MFVRDLAADSVKVYLFLSQKFYKSNNFSTTTTKPRKRAAPLINLKPLVLTGESVLIRAMHVAGSRAVVRITVTS